MGEDIRALRELELLPEDPSPTTAQVDGATEEKDKEVAVAPGEAQHSRRSGRLGDLDWFEELIDGSRLGRTQKTRRGMGVTADGSAHVQWEVSEYVEGAQETAGATAGANAAGAKRKIGDVVVDGDDVRMKQ
jgi:hypothetical protein